jgi:DNA-binding NarL/FixJ family response regulator
VIRVFLADDHAIFREGVRRILDHAEDMQVVGEAADGKALIAALPKTPCDVLVLDLNMPEVGGVDALRQVRAAYPRLGVLVLTMYAEDSYAARLLRAGASGYLAKGRSAEELVEAVRRIAGGGRYVTSNVAEHLLDAADVPPHESLSDREHQVFMLVVQGKSPSEIANELGVGASTVSTYLARIKKQLHVQTIGEIVRYASRAGLI